MLYAILFLEGVITFISPCLLPMLPVYISYFAGGEGAAGQASLRTPLGFVAGFTCVFVLLGAFAGFAGSLLTRHRMLADIIAGAIVILFGLNYLGVINIKFLNAQRTGSVKITGFLSALLFGAAFSISWTPCVSAFLGSALMMASRQGTTSGGILLLLCYSMGLGLPFLLSALLINNLKSAFDFIKKHYKIINTVSGLLLVATGLLMATGLMGVWPRGIV